MVLLLARMIIKQGTYDPDVALRSYRFWLDSEPFDCCGTIRSCLRGKLKPESQANGALRRVSSLGVLGIQADLNQVAPGSSKHCLDVSSSPLPVGQCACLPWR